MRERFRNAGRNRVLHFEDIREGLVEYLRPELAAVDHAQQMHRNAQVVVLTLNQAIEHGVDLELAARGERILIDSRVTAHRAERRDDLVAALRQLRDERVRHAEFERRIALLRHERLEGQDRERAHWRLGAGGVVELQHHRTDRERGEQQEHHSGEPLPAALARLHRRQRLALPHLGDEPVALAGQSCDVAVLAAFLAEELPECGNDLREAVLFDDRARPDRPEQRVLVERLAGMLDEIDQRIERLAGQRHGIAAVAARQALLGDVQLEIAEFVARAGVGHRAITTNQNSSAGGEGFSTDADAKSRR